jgi:molecular chaperone GrpE
VANQKTHGAPEAPEPSSEAAEDEPKAAEQAAEEGSGLAPVLAPPPDLGAAEAYHQRARLAEDRLGEVLGAYRKLKLENEAHRERTAKNIERRFDQRRERLLLKFIDILDNLDRALEAAETSYGGEPLIEGLILVRTQLLQTLQEEGLERIPAIGRPFDPTFAEAVEARPVDDPDYHHVVMKELMRGYRLNGRVARAARVAIGEYSGPLPTSAPDPSLFDTASLSAARLDTRADDAPDAPLAELADQPVPQGPGSTLEEPSPSANEDEAFEAARRSDGELTLEEIVAHAEAQEALFPEVFDDPPPGGKDKG